ncbi:MAG TPA: hypothetical protein VK479_10545 [Micropepsaceae bacterium]|jgi:hypothetical protein|nr:hypothetical protein [Micropepsaceae bacterium]
MPNDDELDLNDPATLIGRTIIIGMTYVDLKGDVVRQEQHHGTIIDFVNWNLIVERAGQENFYIPYDLRAISIAPKGTYRLRESGKEIENPDLLSSWIVEPPGTPPEIQ